MAETSGFFQAQWDSSLIDPTTGEATGWWDRNYIAQQFASYFALFIGNGVFGSPTNQCKVVPGTGLNVVVTPGWAFINGYWYHNDANLTLAVPSNSGTANRNDSVRLRWVDADRAVQAVYVQDSTTNTRTSTVYDLKLADVKVAPNVTSISASDITDTRTDEAVCGLVKGLMEVETTADLFAQYQSEFDEWFDAVKDQLTGDLAIRLQLEFAEIEAGFEADQALITDYVEKDYVRPLQTFTFTNKVCTISDANIKATSLVDVYFTAESIPYAEAAKIVVDTSAGAITMTAAEQPTGTIQGYIRVRVN